MQFFFIVSFSDQKEFVGKFFFIYIAHFLQNQKAAMTVSRVTRKETKKEWMPRKSLSMMRPLHKADESLGWCIPGTMCPVDDSSHRRCISWTMCPLDIASLGHCVPWTRSIIPLMMCSMDHSPWSVHQEDKDFNNFLRSMCIVHVESTVMWIFDDRLPSLHVLPLW